MTQDQNTQSGKDNRRRNDIALVSALFLTGAVVLLVFAAAGRKRSPEDLRVRVRVGNQIAAYYDLSEDRTIEISGKDGGTNALVIQDGCAYMEEASCPDGLCVKMGKIRYAGQSIVCLPNEVAVDLVSDSGAVPASDQTAPDAVSQ